MIFSPNVFSENDPSSKYRSNLSSSSRKNKKSVGSCSGKKPTTYVSQYTTLGASPKKKPTAVVLNSLVQSLPFKSKLTDTPNSAYHSPLKANKSMRKSSSEKIVKQRESSCP